MKIPDVVFISSDEPNADDNFARLLRFAPHAKRVRGQDSIYAAYKAAAELAESERFFMVDGDNWILDGFVFADHVHNTEADRYVWRAINPVNGIINIHGGIKFVRTDIVRTMNPKAVDFYNTMGGVRGMVKTPASEHRFNTTPYLTWRGAFRECAKITGCFAITPAKARELVAWQTRGARQTHGLHCLLGARMGAAFGRAHRGAPELGAINSRAFMEDSFARVTALGSLDVLREERPQDTDTR